MKWFYIVLFLFQISVTKAQKQDRIWLFPDSGGIDFNNLSNPVSFRSNISYPTYWSTNISDNQGQLLFYVCGANLNLKPMRIYDRNGDLMQGADTLEGYPWVCQGSMILPMPDDSMKYYVFIARRDGGLGNSMFYNLVDMNLNGGLGEVISRDNLLISDHVNEKLNATKHANGRDWWIILMSTNTNQLFHKFLITPQGIQGPFDQLIGSSDNRNSFHGQMIFSKDGSKLGLVGSNSSVDIYDFDRCTGDLFNYKQVGEGITTLQNYYFGCSFSPNGNIFYTSSIWYEYKNIYQYDLTAFDIRSTKQLIYAYQDTGVYQGLSIGAHLLGPDGKIYIAKGDAFIGGNSDTYYTHHMDVITDPNNPGIACNYTSCYLDLGSGRAVQGLPTMVNYNLGPVSGSVCDSLSIGIDEQSNNNSLIQIFPNPFNKSITIQSTQPIDGLMKVYNELGSIVFSNHIIGNHNLDLTFLPSGNYILEIIGTTNVFRKKISKMD
ncbi:MAG: T9SS type A sorting domain-containing protein [Bacteroidia bacterium]|nr:T9SS type A sorting domain-containing protein [Bacteroidia bacterium]MBP9922546.1 T9SS type A sorting domain-containing protein [Bacteroidia bacterium]